MRQQARTPGGASLFLAAFLCAPAAAQTTVVEDLTNDSNPALAGFAGSRFVHALSGGYQLVSESTLSGIAPYPSSPFALWLLNGRDDVTFSLAGGESITRARVACNSLYG